MNRFILLVLLILPFKTMAQSDLHNQVYTYATMSLKQGGLELSEKDALLFVRHVLSQKNPSNYFVNHTKIYVFSIRKEKEGGIGLSKNNAIDLASEIAVVVDSDLSIAILAKGVGFATLSESQGGLGYSKSEAVAFAQRFPTKEHGLGKLQAYIQLYMFAKNELGHTKEDALKYAESFLEEN